MEVSRLEQLKASEKIVAQVEFDVARGANDDSALQKTEYSRQGSQAEHRAAIKAQLSGRNTRRQVVNRVLEDPWAGERNRRCGHNTEESDRESGAIATHVGEQPPGRRHSASMT